MRRQLATEKTLAPAQIRRNPREYGKRRLRKPPLRALLVLTHLNQLVATSSQLLAGQVLAWWLLFPVRLDVDLVAAAAALRTDHARAEPLCHQVLHAQLAHVAERHRGYGGLLGFHCGSVAEFAPRGWALR